MSVSVLTNCALATMRDGDSPYGLVEQGAVAIDEGNIVWAGAVADLPKSYRHEATEDLGGQLVTPALIDCHTHLVHGGNRAREFEMRLNGASYQEIAESGGGIFSTVRATRGADDETLISEALPRLDRLLAEGVAVVEIKSGYGLTIEDEIRILKAARRLGELRPVKIVTSWLAAHAVPPEYKGATDTYIDKIVIPGLERAAAEGLVDAVDGYCETIAFTPHQLDKVFRRAKALGLPTKLHAEQLSDQKGAVMAAKAGALSVDHLEYLAADDVPLLAEAGTVAVLLPGAYYYLRETKTPPVDALRAARVPLAVATDCNPGTSPLSSLSLAMNMACTLFRLTPEEALAGATRNAAKALGLDDEYGVIASGKRAELAVWDAKHPAELSYKIGGSSLVRKITSMRPA